MYKINKLELEKLIYNIQDKLKQKYYKDIRDIETKAVEKTEIDDIKSRFDDIDKNIQDIISKYNLYFYSSPYFAKTRKEIIEAFTKYENRKIQEIYDNKKSSVNFFVISFFEESESMKEIMEKIEKKYWITL